MCKESLVNPLELLSFWELSTNWVNYALKLLLVRLHVILHRTALVWFSLREGFSFHGFLKCKRLIG